MVSLLVFLCDGASDGSAQTPKKGSAIKVGLSTDTASVDLPTSDANMVALDTPHVF